MLIPEVAAGAAGDLNAIREAAIAAVDWAAGGSRVGLLIPEVPVVTDDWSLNGFGVAVGRGTPVGLAQAVGRWLLGERPAHVVGPDASLRAFDGVLVMGDASASRTDKAPGHTHPEAVSFDDAVLRALRDGDAEALSGVDLELAAQVSAAGAPAWVALSRQIAAVDSAAIDAVADPFGVLYVVARWTVRWADPA